MSYVEIAAGSYHNLARRSDGRVIAWGASYSGQTSVPVLPPGVSFLEISAGGASSAARCSDRAIRVWGATSGNLQVAPALAPGQRFADITMGESSLVGLVETVWTSYCSAKTNSLGCVPEISATGSPSASASSGFTVQGAQVRNQKSGLLFYTVNGNRAALPYQCGTLCVGPGGIRRTPGRSSAGSALPASDCSGLYAIDMNAFAGGAAGGSPDPALQVPGTLVHAQWWGRDNGFAPPCGTTLSDALEYSIAP